MTPSLIATIGVRATFHFQLWQNLKTQVQLPSRRPVSRVASSVFIPPPLLELPLRPGCCHAINYGVTKPVRLLCSPQICTRHGDSEQDLSAGYPTFISTNHLTSDLCFDSLNIIREKLFAKIHNELMSTWAENQATLCVCVLLSKLLLVTC